jgi:hypothetical protein
MSRDEKSATLCGPILRPDTAFLSSESAWPRCYEVSSKEWRCDDSKAVDGLELEVVPILASHDSGRIVKKWKLVTYYIKSVSGGMSGKLPLDKYC